MGLKERIKRQPRPVQEITLSEKHFKLRLALVITFIVIGVAAFVFGVISLGDEDPGWYRIAVTGTTPSLGDEMVLMYRLGSGDMSVAKENNAVAKAYTDASIYMYRLFHPSETLAGTRNVATVNEGVNSTVTVDEPLYEAFSLVKKYGDRSIFLAPIYLYCENLFSAENDYVAEEYDPARSEETAELFRAIAAFASDPESVDITLLGDNRVRLSVSEEYLAFAEKNEFSVFVDFYRLKNAFAADYIADKLIEAGFTSGALSTGDGFSRNLDDSGIGFAVNVYDKDENGGVTAAAQITYSGRRAFCTMRNFFADASDIYFYEYENGDTATAFIDTASGLPKSAVNSLTVYSDGRSCAELALSVSRVYIADELDTDALSSLARDGIHYVYCKGGFVHYSDENIALGVSRSGEYTPKLDK